MQSTFAHGLSNIFHKLHEHRIVKSKKKSNNTGLFTNFKMSEIPKKVLQL